MNVENSLISEQQFVVLLGKKYPVIVCRDDADLITSNANTVDASSSALLGVTTEMTNVITSTLSNETALSGMELSTTNSIQQATSNLDKQSSSCGSVGEAAVPNERHDVKNGTELAPDISLSKEPLSETEIANDDLSTDDAVALALAINEDHEQQSFQYEIDAEDNTSGINIIPNPVEHSQSSSVDSQETCATNPVLESSQEISLPLCSVTSAEAVDTDGGSIEASALSSSENSRSPNQSDEDTPLELPNDDAGPGFSVSSKLNISDYAQSEWKGTTYTAECLRNGYQMLIKNTERTFMRQIRGDNYCALRATAFQILTQKTNILSSFSDWKMHLKTLPQRLLNDCKCTWLQNWTFANRLKSTPKNRFSIMQQCLDFFIEQKELSNATKKANDRVAHFTALFNSGSNAEIKLFEAIKLLMLDTAVNLHQLQSRGEEVPIFAWLLFARDTSETPESLMINHLNLAGKSGGLEQVNLLNCHVLTIDEWHEK